MSVSPFCQIPEDTVKNSRFSYIEQGEPVSLDQLGKSKTSPDSGYQSYIQSCIAGLLKVKTVGTLWVIKQHNHHKQAFVDRAGTERDFPAKARRSRLLPGLLIGPSTHFAL